MKIAVIGSGAMGLLFGAKLAEAGNDVTMIDVVPEVLEELRANGIHLEFGDSDKQIPVKASRAEEMTETVDLAILFTKTIYSASALDTCKTYVGEDTWMLTMQNGLGNIELMSNYVDYNKIVAGVTTFGADLIKPGHTKTSGKGYLKIMSANGEVTDDLRAINQVLVHAGLGSQIVDDVMVAIWEKVAFNAAINATTALLHVPCGGMGVVAEGEEICYKVSDEACAVANALGIKADAASVRETLRKTIFELHQDHFTSMAQDVLNKRKTEAAFIPGGVYMQAKNAGLEAPYNEMLYKLLLVAENSYDLQK
jgi:2-dehydropantoate 2-reductase